MQSPYFFTLILVVLPYLALVNSASNDCEDPKNFIILFDNYIAHDEIFECQNFLARLAPSLRSIADGNRVSVGSFSGIISSLKQSESRKSHEMAHAILDTEQLSAAGFNIQQALDITHTNVKEAATSNKKVVVLFIIGSRGHGENENEAQIASAAKFYKVFPNFVGFTVTIGNSYPERIVAALNGNNQDRHLKINHVYELDSLEGQLTVRLACHRTIAPPPPLLKDCNIIDVTLYSEPNYKGQEVTLQVGPKDCVNFNIYNWDNKARSVRHRYNCVIFYDGANCVGMYFPAAEYDPGIDDFGPGARDGTGDWVKRTKSLRQCQPKDRNKQKLNYINVFNIMNYRGYEEKIPLDSIRNCHKTITVFGEGNGKIASLRTNGNCVEVYYGETCDKSWQFEFKITFDIPVLSDVRHVQSIRYCG